MISINESNAANMTLSEYYKQVYRPMRLIGRSARTFQAYDTALTLWMQWPENVPLGRIDSRTIARFSQWLLPGRSPASVNSYLRCIMAFLRFAADEDDIGKPPKFRKLKEMKRVPLALTTEEFLAVLSVARKQKKPVCGIPACDWWASLLCVDWETGLRITALLSIATRDVLLDQGGFYCQAETQKDREAAWYPLSPDTMELVKKIYDPTRKLLWPLDIKANGLGRRFRRFLERSGIYAPKGACMAFHRIRKSTASYIKAAGGDAQRKLCHSSPSITEHYLDPRIVRAAICTDLVAAPLAPKPICHDAVK